MMKFLPIAFEKSDLKCNYNIKIWVSQGATSNIKMQASVEHLFMNSNKGSSIITGICIMFAVR